ncbi:MAG: DNA primase [Desulfovibrio sp.]|nr:DNA primase [Desulfovibrio sp.]
MQQQSKDVIRAVKERLNIVDVVRRYVDLKHNGARWVAPCPFHQETKPSFSVNEEKGMFYCFGCHASGDVLDFYSRINGLDFKETLEQLATEAGIRLDNGVYNDRFNRIKRQERSVRQQILRMYELATSHFIAALQEAESSECRSYIATRGLSDDIVQRFNLGWARRGWNSLVQTLQRAGFNLDIAVEAGLLGRSEKGNYFDRFRGRLIFPIKNLTNQIIAFGGRIIADEKEAKYINSPDTLLYKKGEHLYGLQQARRGITSKNRILLTEGYVDVLTLHQFGYDNAVGVLGTALTNDQIKRMSGFTSNFTLIFDGDRAGRKAALRSCEMLLTRGLSCAVVCLPEGEDIDSLLRGSGSQVFDDLQRQAPDGLRFCVDMLKVLAPRETVEWVRNFLKQVTIPEIVSTYISRLSSYLQISETELRDVLSSTLPVHANNQSPMRASLTRQNILDREIMMYAVRYPHRISDIQAIGADMALRSVFARQLCEKLKTFSFDEVFQHLDQKEKNFWCYCRGPEVPPLDDGDNELTLLRRSLEDYYKTAQTSSLSDALRTRTNNFEADLDYLRAFKETLENRYEQS